jgi:hypothetical protein
MIAAARWIDSPLVSFSRNFLKICLSSWQKNCQNVKTLCLNLGG